MAHDKSIQGLLTNTEDPINHCMALSFLSVSHHVSPHPTLEKLILDFKFGDTSGGVAMRLLLAGQGFIEYLYRTGDYVRVKCY